MQLNLYVPDPDPYQTFTWAMSSSASLAWDVRLLNVLLKNSASLREGKYRGKMVDRLRRVYQSTWWYQFNTRLRTASSLTGSNSLTLASVCILETGLHCCLTDEKYCSSILDFESTQNDTHTNIAPSSRVGVPAHSNRGGRCLEPWLHGKREHAISQLYL